MGKFIIHSEFNGFKIRQTVYSLKLAIEIVVKLVGRNHKNIALDWECHA